MGGKGGVGKTITLVAIADFLRARGQIVAPVDCDSENAGKPSCFGHWFGGQATVLNLRNPADCDALLESAAESDAPYVVADLPANSSGDLAAWWKEVATPETIRELGLKVVAIGAITPQPGAAQSVIEWMATLGERAEYLVALNRIAPEAAPKAKEETFSDWYGAARTVGASASILEIPHLLNQAMGVLTQTAKLPSEAVEGTAIPVLTRQRIKTWRDRIHAQLGALPMFAIEEEPKKVKAGR